MAFEELKAVVAPAPFVLPIKGKLYSFPTELSAWAWATITMLSNEQARVIKEMAKGNEVNLSVEVLGNVNEQRLFDEMFGGVEQQLVEDGVSSTIMEIVHQTLMNYHMYGRETAELHWNMSGVKGAETETVPLDEPAPKKRASSRAS